MTTPKPEPAPEPKQGSVCGCPPNVHLAGCTWRGQMEAVRIEPKGSEIQPRCAWEPGTTGVCEAHRSLRAEVERLKAQLASQEANHKAMLETVGAEAAAQLAEKEQMVAWKQELLDEVSKNFDIERAARERSESVILNTAKLWSENRHYNVVREEVLAEARAILAVRAKEGESR